MNQYLRAAEYIDEQFRVNPPKLPCSEAEVNKFISRFQKEYNPNELKKISKEDSIDKILMPYTDFSMIGELMQEAESASPSGVLGHVGNQHSNNFPLARAKDMMGYFKVGRGMPSHANDVLPLEQAEGVAYDFINTMADVCLDINKDQLNSVSEYVELGKRLETKIGTQANHAWFHKYLYLLFPDKFTNFHTADYRNKVLTALGIEPEKSFYGTAGQFAEIRKHMELKDAYLMAFVIYSDAQIMSIFDDKSSSKQSRSLFEKKDEEERESATDRIFVDSLEEELDSLELDGEERQAVVNVRVNQDVFRQKLLKKYDKCCLCSVSEKSLLVASHIKPWAKCEASEKLDVNNGFLMCPNHDKLFDQGWITFDDNGEIVISDDLAPVDRLYLNVKDGMKITITEANKDYLAYHRNNIFRK